MLRFSVLLVNICLALLVYATAAAQEVTPTPQMSSTAWIAPTLTPFVPTPTPLPTSTPTPFLLPAPTVEFRPIHFIFLALVAH